MLACRIVPSTDALRHERPDCGALWSGRRLPFRSAQNELADGKEKMKPDSARECLNKTAVIVKHPTDGRLRTFHRITRLAPAD
jgi:hypothetical protein